MTSSSVLGVSARAPLPPAEAGEEGRQQEGVDQAGSSVSALEGNRIRGYLDTLTARTMPQAPPGKSRAFATMPGLFVRMRASSSSLMRMKVSRSR
jgi:hypothetical protein